MNNNSLSISELNHFIRDVLNSGFPQSVWVCGEIQGYDRGKDKKHVFFELCEKDPVSRDITARIGLVLFAMARPKIEAILKKAENAFELKDDIEVKFLCKIDFYPGHGQVRLIVESIDPVHTLGKIAQDRQRLISVLKQKGILDKNKQLSLSVLPLRIGLITSYDSAAYHDFIAELKSSGFAFEVFVVNTLMQGKNAESSVLKAFNCLKNTLELDVMIITRGGGSIAELSCFDSEKIALAIAQASVPVLSGIGHEINTTVTDLAAHTFAKTPTAIAQFLVHAVRMAIEALDMRRMAVMDLSGRILKAEHQRLKDNAFFLQTKTLRLVKNHQQRLMSITEALHRGPAIHIKASRARCVDYQDHVKKIIHLRLQNSRIKIIHYEKLARMADPLNILKRGFSITRNAHGFLVRSMRDVVATEEITTALADGVFHSTVSHTQS